MTSIIGQRFLPHHRGRPLFISAALSYARLASFPILLHPISSQLAIRRYKLFNLRAELFLNTCDLPSIHDSAAQPVDKAGLPVFSTQHLAGTMDILYPDPLDLTEGYIPLGRKRVSIVRLTSRCYMDHGTLVGTTGIQYWDPLGIT